MLDLRLEWYQTPFPSDMLLSAIARPRIKMSIGTIVFVYYKEKGTRA